MKMITVASPFLAIGCTLGALTAPIAYAQNTPSTPVKAHPLNGVSAIPMRMSYNPLITALPIVYLRINGGPLRPFLFDTGYSGTILLNEVEANALHLRTMDAGKRVTDINGVSEKLRKTVVRKVEGLVTDGSFFDTNVHELFVSKIPVNDERVYPFPVAGIVGLDLFWGATLYLDFDQQTLQIIPGEHPDVAAAPGAIAVPFDYDGQRLRIDASVLLGSKEPMILDTGAVKSFFPRALAQRLKPAGIYDAYAPGAYNSHTPAKMYFLPSVPLAGATIQNLLVGEAQEQKAILGIDILSRFRLTIDTRRQKVVLEPNRALPFRNAKPLGRSGLEVERRGGVIVIANAVAAYKALIGGELVRLNDPYCQGKVLATLPVAQVQALLDGYAGTSATIVVRLAGIDKTVTFQRMSVPEMYRAKRQK